MKLSGEVADAYEPATGSARHSTSASLPRPWLDLVVHLDRKTNEARKLKRPRGRTVEQLTAGLYNGGSHNVQG